MREAGTSEWNSRSLCPATYTPALHTAWQHDWMINSSGGMTPQLLKKVMSSLKGKSIPLPRRRLNLALSGSLAGCLPLLSPGWLTTASNTAHSSVSYTARWASHSKCLSLVLILLAQIWQTPEKNSDCLSKCPSWTNLMVAIIIHMDTASVHHSKVYFKIFHNLSQTCLFN